MDIVHIGKILRPHGLDGAVSVRVFADVPRNLKPGIVVSLEPETPEYKSLSVQTVQKYKNSYRVVFREIQGRAEAESLAGKFLGIPEESLEDLPDDEYYIFDLVGCEIFTPSGLYKGHVDDVESNPGNDLLKIINNDNIYLVPMVRQFVKSIDLKKRRIVIEPIEGLLDPE